MWPCSGALVKNVIKSTCVILFALFLTNLVVPISVVDARSDNTGWQTLTSQTSSFSTDPKTWFMHSKLSAGGYVMDLANSRENNGEATNVLVGGNSSSFWIADQPEQVDSTYLSGTWHIDLFTTGDWGTKGSLCQVEVGIWDGSAFSSFAKGSMSSLFFSSYPLYNLRKVLSQPVASVIKANQYLALKITNNDSVVHDIFTSETIAVSVISGTYRQPTVTGISPASGPVNGWTPVTITGTNFYSDITTLKIGGAFATGVTIVGATSLTAITPSGTLGSQDVVVTTPGGSATLNGGYAYYAMAPTAASVVPDVGPEVGGTPVTLSGGGFYMNNTTVTFGGKLAGAVTIISATSLTAIAPSGTLGARDVVVTTPGGSATLTGGFTYYMAAPTLVSILPVSALNTGGTSVTIMGTGFTAAGTLVSIGGAPATDIAVLSSTSLTAITPSGTLGAQDVVVTTHGGSATLTGGFTYYLVVPTLVSILPVSGLNTGGTSVTIAGTGFNAAGTLVSIGGTTATGVTVLSATTLTAITPSGTLGAQNVVVTTPGGSATLTSGYTYYAVASGGNGNGGGGGGSGAPVPSATPTPASTPTVTPATTPTPATTETSTPTPTLTPQVVEPSVTAPAFQTPVANATTVVTTPSGQIAEVISQTPTITVSQPAVTTSDSTNHRTLTVIAIMASILIVLVSVVFGIRMVLRRKP
jgi:hypothetical protein